MSVSLEASYAHCERVARRAARNFYYGFRALPRPKRLALCALYAYMRQVDDLADTPGDADTKRRRLLVWRVRTERALAGEHETEPFWPALADTVRRYKIPPRYLLDVVAGAEMDLDPCVYSSFADLRRYCYHVAGAVGLACVYIFGFAGSPTPEEALDGDSAPADTSTPRALELAEEMGIAFQLTNILRDLGQDYRMGRVYLPQEDFDRFGCRPGDLARDAPPEHCLVELLRFEAARAWEFYERAWALIPLVSEDSRRALWALASIYSKLLREIERRGFDVFTSRVRLTTAQKLWLLFRARFGPMGAYEFDQRDRRGRGPGRPVLRHRSR